MISTNQASQYDCILIGGGLQGGLLALAIKHFHPDARVLMIERGSCIAGNHTWSFHPGDVPKTAHDWLTPLVEHRWDGYKIRLGKFVREVGLEYASISSRHFAEVVGQLFQAREVGEPQTLKRSVGMAIAVGATASWEYAALASEPVHDVASFNIGSTLLTDTEVVAVSNHEVETRCGQTFRSELVIDCRGPSHESRYVGCGFQKFFGFEVQLDEDWPETQPVVMEGTEDQSDGFHFLYTLPFEPRRVLIEDTWFSDTPDLDRNECLDFVRRYSEEKGVNAFRVVREESGVLPMPFSSEQKPSSGRPLSGGYAGGWFHSATGYSFPMAVAFAQAVASGPLKSAGNRVHELSLRHRWRASYSRFLNRLLFRLVAPKYRQQIFRRFYRVLDESAVERFYSHQFRPFDAFRIIVGIPPTLMGLRPFRFIRSFSSGATQ